MSGASRDESVDCDSGPSNVMDTVASKVLSAIFGPYNLPASKGDSLPVESNLPVLNCEDCRIILIAHGSGGWVSNGDIVTVVVGELTADATATLERLTSAGKVLAWTLSEHPSGIQGVLDMGLIEKHVRIMSKHDKEAPPWYDKDVVRMSERKVTRNV